MTPTKQNELQQNLLVGSTSALNQSYNPTNSAAQNGNNSSQVPFTAMISQAAPQSTSQAGFQGFSHIGKPVQIKHRLSDGPQSQNLNTRGTSNGQASGSARSSAQQLTSSQNTKSMKFIDAITQAAQQHGQVPNSLSVNISSGILHQADKKTYHDFHKMLQQESYLQQQIKSNQAYNQQGRVSNNGAQTNNNASPSPSASALSFNRPGRKVVQRPPSAKQKVSTYKQQGSTKMMQQNKVLSSQSIVLRQRGQNSQVQLTPQQQHLKAVRNQRDAVAAFLDKKYLNSDLSHPINQKQVQSAHGQVSATHLTNGLVIVPNHHNPKKSAGVKSHRDFSGLINTSSIVYSSAQNVMDQNGSEYHLILRDNPSQQVPQFISINNAGMATASHTLAKDYQLRLLKAASHGSTINNQTALNLNYLIGERLSDTTKQSLKRDSMTNSHAPQANHSSGQEYALLLKTVSSQNQEIVAQNKCLLKSSVQEPIKTTLLSPQGINGVKVGPSKQTQQTESHQNEFSAMSHSKSFKNIPSNQSVSLMTQSVSLSKRRQSNQVVVSKFQGTKMLDSKSLVTHQNVSQQEDVLPQSNNLSPTGIGENEQKKSVRRPNRSARPKSGIPINRAPFRPAGIAQPSEIMQSSKRHNQSKVDLRKSGTFGRTINSGDKEAPTSGREELKQPQHHRAMSSKPDTKRQLFSGKDQEVVNKKNDSDSYGDSYGYDDEVSYYSDDQDEDENGQKEKLEYDDGNEYSPGKSHYIPIDLMNPPVGDQAAKESKTLVENNKSKQVVNNTIQVKTGKEDLQAQKDSKFQTFGTLDKKGVQQSLLDKVGQDNKAAGARESLAEKTSNDLQGSAEDEDLSVGYLDNDEGMGEGEDQRNSNDVSIERHTSLKHESQLTISTSQSPEIRGKRTIKLKAAQVPLNTEKQSTRKSVIKPILGISTSTKLIEKPNSYMGDQQSTASKKSLQLSDSCPKENLVRQLYQRPGIIESFDGLNSRLRSMSVKRSYEQGDVDSASSQYQIRKNSNRDMSKSGQARGVGQGQTLMQELMENQRKVQNYIAKDPYSSQQPVFLMKSPFTGRPPTVFFQYPPGISEKEKPVEKDHIFKMKQNKFKLRFKVADGVHTYNCVVNSLCWAGFQQTDNAGWNVMWSAPLKPETLRNYDMYKHNNHFPGTWQLGRKDLMFRNISAQMREFGEEYNIVPKTWILPYDLRIFQKERDDTAGKMLWILKPAASSCGRGIKILNKQSSLPKKGPYVVNQYIMKPHLLGGFKYDLRIYVLVTCFEPLTIYMYNDGLVRFATQPYTTKNRKSRFAHLTNFSVNKKADNYKKAGQKDQSEENSSKWRLGTLISAFKRQGLDWDGLWEQIGELVIKAIISVEPLIANNTNRASRNRHLCFEVYGFDVIFDSQLKPWLLEVNVLPSLSSSSQLDKKVKTAMMTDVFSTIGIVPYNKKKYERAMEFSYWNRFSGLKKQTVKQQSFKDDGQQQYFGASDQKQQHNAKAKQRGDSAIDQIKNYGNVDPVKDAADPEVSSEEENLAWTQTQNNMAQSQSNYLQSTIRNVKDLTSTYDFNIEEQLVIVEVCEEYSRRGNFEMIFPRKATIDKYKKYFKVQRACNILMWKWLKLGSNALTTPSSKQTKGAKNAESRNQNESSSNMAAIGPKTRFSVLKDFKIRKNCASRFIDDIKQI